MQNYSLQGKRAIACGSTQGIGRACAIEFARLGASVTLVARDEAALTALREELSVDSEQTHHHLVAEFTDWEGLRAAIQTHVEAHGPFHILLNNTGGPPAGPAHEASPEMFMAAFQQHLASNQVLVQAVIDGMRAEGYGRIINIISTSVIQPIPNLGVSNTIRGAVANWGRTLAAELGPDGITVNNILPGFTATARLRSLFQGKADRTGSTLEEVEEAAKAGIPLRRLADPSEIAAVAAFLASPAGSYVNGVNLPVDGGRLVAQ